MSFFSLFIQDPLTAIFSACIVFLFLYVAVSEVLKSNNYIKNQNSKLEEFAVTSEVLEEIVENREQIEISKYYEKLSHPTILALEEFKRDELFYREREESSEESSEASHDEQGEQ